ncbi:Chymotrypsinogen B [Desmophyllum pertusum]|uniref:Chymotrypsinogen B n=1 Tax=Desmophyllum pertusum TaxID=174260 RepID=A0A9X0CXQ7_9CNID|nr:Chymotrypsinogen B [Desmophyllum pertusum]
MFVALSVLVCILTPIAYRRWGRINPSNNQLAPLLKQASAPVATHSQCRATNGRTVDESSMVCVGGQGSSVCNGDSGGPLSCNEGGRWVLRGAASWVTSKTCPGRTYSSVRSCKLLY